jgi:hypothetical protein
MANDVVPGGSNVPAKRSGADISPDKFEALPDVIQPGKTELEGMGGHVEQGLSEEFHPGGYRRRVIGIPEETQVDEYTGELAEPTFDYLEKLFRNRPEAHKPLPCEAPGSRHAGYARHFIKVPGQEMHMPVCDRHLKALKLTQANTAVSMEPSPASEYMGGEEFSSYPITKDDRLAFRIHRARQKKLGEFRDESFAQQAGAVPWTGRNKPTHGPGRAPKPKKASDELSENDFKDLVAAGWKSTLPAIPDVISRSRGGKSRLHLAHQALLRSLSTADDGSVQPSAEAYYYHAKNLGLENDEARSLIVPAIAHHKRVHKTTSFVPPAPPTTQFKKVAEEEFFGPARVNELASAAGLTPISDAETDEQRMLTDTSQLATPAIPAPVQSKPRRNTRSQ